MFGRKCLSALFALGLAAVLWPGQSAADSHATITVTTTKDLLNICTLADDDAMRERGINYCLGYIDGAVSYHDAISASTELDRFVCYPETATVEIGAAVFIEWARQNQGNAEFMGTAPVVGVVRALEAKWPCA